MEDAKPRNGRRVALGMTGVAFVWLLGVWPPPVWWRDHWPRETALMREATEGRNDRSEERRVGKERRPRWAPSQEKEYAQAAKCATRPCYNRAADAAERPSLPAPAGARRPAHNTL